jgi:hypothetical protein
MEALDPNEGPTAWIDTEAGNKHTVKVLFGTDPNHPFEEFLLSKNEISKLHEEAQKLD